MPRPRFDLIVDLNVYPLNDAMVVEFRQQQVAYLPGWTQQQGNQLVDTLVKVCEGLETAYNDLADEMDELIRQGPRRDDDENVLC
jgi:hypothetical protein